jgi:hypothetical protein
MRLSRFLSIVSCVTCFSLLYVYQQAEIFRLAYLGQKNRTAFQELLDKNTLLRYNIGRSGSLVQIGDKISDSADFQMPDSYKLVRISPSREGFRLREANPEKQPLLSRVFGIKSQAEAKTLNP